jgi:hypothetical protein
MNCRRGDVEIDRAMDYIEKIGKGQWKYVMKFTLLRFDESGQFVVLGGDSNIECLGRSVSLLTNF